jgi:hypothetical protein
MGGGVQQRHGVNCVRGDEFADGANGGEVVGGGSKCQKSKI